MAKIEKYLNGDFDHLVRFVHDTVLSKSISATFEDSTDYAYNNMRVATRVYERYSFLGKNRVSLNVTIIGVENNLYCSAITSGGSQGVFLKINTFGESGFLNTLKDALDNYTSY